MSWKKNQKITSSRLEKEETKFELKFLQRMKDHRFEPVHPLL